MTLYRSYLPKHERRASLSTYIQLQDLNKTMTDVIFTKESDEAVLQKAREALSKETDWLLKQTHSQMNTTIIFGLLECKTRLTAETETRLVMSSGRSEAIKGIVVRQGSRLKSGELKIRLAAPGAEHELDLSKKKIEQLQQKHIQSKEDIRYVLRQVVDTVNLIDQAVEGIRRARFSHVDMALSVLTRLLSLLRTATKCIKYPSEGLMFPVRSTEHDDPDLFAKGMTVDFYLEDSSVVTDVRAFTILEDKDSQEASDSDHHPQSSNNSFSNNSSTSYHAHGGTSTAANFFKSIGIKTRKINWDNVFEFNGHKVLEIERVKVESQDPNLISAMAKLKGEFLILIYNIIKYISELCLLTKDKQLYF